MAKVLVVELPWLQSNKESYQFAGRSGMRWAYTSDKPPILSFRPFPFFLAYTSALLKKAGHIVKTIDTLAEHINYNDFLDLIKNFKADFLIA